MVDTKTKPWYASKTVWGTALVGLGFVLNFFGVTLTPTDQTAIVEAGPDTVNAVIQFVGLIIAMYGRLTAKEALTATK